MRDTDSITAHDNLTVVQGSPLSEADMNKAFSAGGAPIDAVLIFLNPKRTSTRLWAGFIGPPRLIADTSALSAKLLRKQQDMHPEHPRPRLVVMNALGSGESRKVTPWIFGLVIDYTTVGRAYEDHTLVSAEIEGNCGDKVAWTVVLAVGLGAEGQKEVKTFRETESGAGWTITRESCARWMIDVAAGQKGEEYNDRRVIVSN